MQARPSALDDFSSFYKEYVEGSTGDDELQRQQQVVLEMYEMLTVNGGKVPSADQVRRSGTEGKQLPVLKAQMPILGLLTAAC